MNSFAKVILGSCYFGSLAFTSCYSNPQEKLESDARHYANVQSVNLDDYILAGQSTAEDGEMFLRFDGKSKRPGDYVLIVIDKKTRKPTRLSWGE